MISCESLYQHSCEVVFAFHEYIFVWNKYIVEDYEGFLSAEFGIAQIDFCVFLHFSCVAGLSAVYHVQAFCIRGDCECYSKVLVLLFH